MNEKILRQFILNERPIKPFEEFQAKIGQAGKGEQCEVPYIEYYSVHDTGVRIAGSLNDVFRHNGRCRETAVNHDRIIITFVGSYRDESAGISEKKMTCKPAYLEALYDDQSGYGMGGYFVDENGNGLVSEYITGILTIEAIPAQVE